MTLHTREGLTREWQLLNSEFNRLAYDATEFVLTRTDRIGLPMIREFVDNATEKAERHKRALIMAAVLTAEFAAITVTGMLVFGAILYFNATGGQVRASSSQETNGSTGTGQQIDTNLPVTNSGVAEPTKEKIAQLVPSTTPPATISPPSGKSTEHPQVGIENQIALSPVEFGRQQYGLSCEAAEAAGLARFNKIPLTEDKILAALPITDDPDTGFAGKGSEPWKFRPFSTLTNGGGYGIYAAPLESTLDRLLAPFGFQAVSKSGITINQLKSLVRAGTPVEVWGVYGHKANAPTDTWITAKGKAVTAVIGEHTYTILGTREVSGTLQFLLHNPAPTVLSDKEPELEWVDAHTLSVSMSPFGYQALWLEPLPATPRTSATPTPRR